MDNEVSKWTILVLILLVIVLVIVGYVTYNDSNNKLIDTTIQK